MHFLLQTRARRKPMQRVPIFVLGLTFVFSGCAGPKGSYVSRSTVRGPYIDATLSVPDGDWRFLFPNTATCAAMLKLESPVTYTRRGVFGSARGPDGAVCDPVGTASLRQWRGRQGRQEGEMAPTSRADWRVIHKDSEVYLLRGRFGVASRLGLGSTFDAVLMVPNDSVCAPIAESRNATLTFRTSGSQVLNLGACPVLGIASPV
jgi:hypothetical protein